MGQWIENDTKLKEITGVFPLAARIFCGASEGDERGMSYSR
jgi:hypothetical protein